MASALEQFVNNVRGLTGAGKNPDVDDESSWHLAGRDVHLTYLNRFCLALVSDSQPSCVVCVLLLIFFFCYVPQDPCEIWPTT